MTATLKQITLTTLCALTFPILGYAQQVKAQTYVAKGVLIDSLSHEPEAFATVRLMEGQRAIKVGTTEANGRFSIRAPKAGNYELELFAMGKAPVRTLLTFSSTQQVAQLDTLYIKPLSTTLSSATVTAQRPLVKAELDKMTYAIADDPEAKTSTLLEMLRKVPMVTVDGEDNIKVNGNSSFKVYVDGKPNSMMSSNPSMIFKAYPASVIKKIEVITNPGAKYDAEGVAGVLNIITNTQSGTKGYTLTVNASGGNHGGMGSLMGMASVGKFMISAHYGTGYNNQPKTLVDKEREVFADAMNHLYTANSRSNGHGFSQFGQLDASYEFTPKDLLSVSAGIHGYNGKEHTNTFTQMMKASNEQLYAYNTDARTKMLYQGINASADFQHTFADERKLTFSYRYDLDPSNTRAETTNADLRGALPEGFELRDMKVDPHNRSFEHTAQADFTTPLDPKQHHSLAFGLKYIYRINRSNSKEYVRPMGSSDADFTLDAEQSLYFRHRGDIGAAYAEYNLKVGKWAAMLASRYEYYRIRATYPDGKRPDFGTHLNDWVPSASVGFSIKPTMLLKAGYNLRIGRPDISYLSPYRVSYTPESVTYGNPDLTSEQSHNLNLSYSTFGPKLTINATLTYAFSNNGMASYSFVKDGITHTTYGNFQHSKQTTLSTFLNWTFTQSTRFNINASGSYSDYKAQRINSHNSGWNASVWAGIDQTLPWRMKASLWVGGNTPSINLQGKNAGFFFYSLNLNRAFLAEDRLSISLSAGNFIGRYHHFKNHTTTTEFRSLSDTRVDLMHIRVGISYRLGSLKSTVKKVSRSIENEDVIKAQSSSGEQGSQQQ